MGETYLHTPFMKKVIHITEGQRETDIQHYCKSDNVWTVFKVMKSTVFNAERNVKDVQTTQIIDAMIS